MSISLFLLMLGIMFVITGYTHQISPSCDKGVELKLINRKDYNLLNDNYGINKSHLGSSPLFD